VDSVDDVIHVEQLQFRIDCIRCMEDEGRKCLRDKRLLRSGVFQPTLFPAQSSVFLAKECIKAVASNGGREPCYGCM
jgi:hypothetical protein